MDIKVGRINCVTPGCCQGHGDTELENILNIQSRTGLVTLGFSLRDWSLFYNGENVNPIWVLCSIPVIFCPFCGKKLPEIIERPNPPKRICTVTDGGYYCDTCQERLCACKCEIPWMRWMPAPE
jgi:hypothetical protein